MTKLAPVRQDHHELRADGVSAAGSIVMAVAGSAPAYSIAATTATLVGAAGLASPAALLWCGLPMLGIAWAFSYLGRADVNAGAAYSWVGRALHPILGFLSGWALVVSATIFMVAGALPAGATTVVAFRPQGCEQTCPGHGDRRRLVPGHGGLRAPRCSQSRPARSGSCRRSRSPSWCVFAVARDLPRRDRSPRRPLVLVELARLQPLHRHGRFHRGGPRRGLLLLGLGCLLEPQRGDQERSQGRGSRRHHRRDHRLPAVRGLHDRHPGHPSRQDDRREQRQRAGRARRGDLAGHRRQDPHRRRRALDDRHAGDHAHPGHPHAFRDGPRPHHPAASVGPQGWRTPAFATLVVIGVSLVLFIGSNFLGSVGEILSDAHQLDRPADRVLLRARRHRRGRRLPQDHLQVGEELHLHRPVAGLGAIFMVWIFIVSIPASTRSSSRSESVLWCSVSCPIIVFWRKGKSYYGRRPLELPEDLVTSQITINSNDPRVG